MSKPRKSKAFIITFILVIILLFVGYWLFSNKDKIFGTGEMNLGKIFEPLLGTSDRVGLDVITDKRGGTNQGTIRVIFPSEVGEVIRQNAIVYAVGA
ncbi:MAG: hypothetical protein PHT84_05630, partial [Candidatus Pacebacteria bacterium]|nr:hypothetical protein [Candidatus Paceibacterota bacterium]